MMSLREIEMKKKTLNRLDSNVKYADTKPLKEKLISIMVSKNAHVVTSLLTMADIPLEMYRELKI